MSAPKQGRASELSKERWRIARRLPSTVIFADRPLGHLDANHNKRGRNFWQNSSHLGTSKENLSSPSHFRFVFSNCWARLWFGGLGRHHRKASGERGSLSRQSKGAKQEKRNKKETNHLRNGSSQPNFDHAPMQRTRNNLPCGGGHPRSIASGL